LSFDPHSRSYVGSLAKMGLKLADAMLDTGLGDYLNVCQ
jgi:hypothetical protein